MNHNSKLTSTAQVIHTLSILATILTLVPLELTHFKVGDAEFHFSLFRCTDCEDGMKEFSYTCFDKLYCDSDLDGLCDMGKLQNFTASLYAGLAGFGVLCQLLVIERLAALKHKLDFGSLKLFWSFLLLGWGAVVTAGVVWVVKGDVQLSGSCSNDDGKSSVDICASKAAYLIPTAMGLVTIGLILTGLAINSRDKTLDEGIIRTGNGQISGISRKLWCMKVALAQAAAVVFIGLSLDWRWVYYYDTSQQTKYYGKLLIWEDLHDVAYEDFGHNCLRSSMCAVDDGSPYCEGFKKLDKAGQLFMSFEAAALLCIAFWFEHILHFLVRREFGFVKLNCLWAPLSLLLHLCAIGCYAGISEVTFGSSCDLDDDSSTIKFCAELGPVWSCLACICLGFGSLFDYALWRHRKVLLEDNIHTVSVDPSYNPQLDLTKDNQVPEDETLKLKRLESPNFNQETFDSPLFNKRPKDSPSLFSSDTKDAPSKKSSEVYPLSPPPQVLLSDNCFICGLG
jgi:hypothetical protein